MLEMGVFGGSYFGGKIKEYPKLWFKNGKLSKTFDVEKNRFKVKAGLTRKEWLEQRMDFQRRSTWLVSMVLQIYKRKKNSPH